MPGYRKLSDRLMFLKGKFLVVTFCPWSIYYLNIVHLKPISQYVNIARLGPGIRKVPLSVYLERYWTRHLGTTWWRVCVTGFEFTFSVLSIFKSKVHVSLLRANRTWKGGIWWDGMGWIQLILLCHHNVSPPCQRWRCRADVIWFLRLHFHPLFEKALDHRRKSSPIHPIDFPLSFAWHFLFFPLWYFIIPPVFCFVLHNLNSIYIFK